MVRRKLAAADIGSNTVHVLVAETDGVEVQRLVNESDWLSLGEVVAKEKCIPLPMEQRLLATLRRYIQTVREHRAEQFYVFATEAMRVAENHDEIMGRIEDLLGVRVDLITPRREAELSFIGASIDSDPNGPVLLVEVGGGSAQLARCDACSVQLEVSLPLGTGKLISKYGLTTPPNPDQMAAMQKAIQGHLEVVREWPKVSRVIGSGGVARGLVRALHPDGERELHLVELDYLLWSAERLSIEPLMLRFGVKQKRAQTLVPGTAVIRSALQAFGQDRLTVSSFGVREGAILELYHGRVNGWQRKSP